jgi:pimeloyl-ACP methyl ester carboxylesterase
MEYSRPAKTNVDRYAEVNGIRMYYELYGEGFPLVLIHGGGSTINTTFGSVLPLLALKNQVIAVELQAHGHTSDRPQPESFEQDADDVAELLKQIAIGSANIIGFSNGGSSAMRLATRHPELTQKLVIASAFYTRKGMVDGFWAGMEDAKFSEMPQVYKDDFLRINNNPAALLNMFEKDARRMQTFEDWDKEDLQAISAPTLIVIGDQDIIKPEHAVEMYRLVPKCRLAILPGNHGSYIGEAMSRDISSQVPECFVSLVNEFFLSNSH